MSLNTHSVYTIAKKEFIDHIRNRWILILSIVFIILTLASSFLAAQESAGDQTLGGVKITVLALLSIAEILIPILAIMLGFATIAGEAESGSLALVLSYPVRRAEVLLGKFLGLGGILAFTSLLGFGISGIIITAFSGPDQILSYLAFIGLTILLGLAFLSPAICFSARLKRRITAMGAGIFLFFWSLFIYAAITEGIFFATTKFSTAELASGTITFPDWLWWSQALNPRDMYGSMVQRIFSSTSPVSYTINLPSYAQLGLQLLFTCLWIIIPLLLAYLLFRRRDI